MDGLQRADGRDGTEVLMRFKHNHDCAMAGEDAVFISTVRFGHYMAWHPICAETHLELRLISYERQVEPEESELGPTLSAAEMEALLHHDEAARVLSDEEIFTKEVSLEELAEMMKVTPTELAQEMGVDPDERDT